MKTAMPGSDRCSRFLLRDLIRVSVLGLLGSLLAGPAVAATNLAAGSVHACVLDGGQVKCWGRNNFGQLGDGSRTDRVTPVAVSDLGNASALLAGNLYTCAIDGGAVKCWGTNDWGQLGNGTTMQSSTPVPVSGISNAGALEAGSNHACAIVGGQVKCWGKNDFGQLGNGTTSFSPQATPVTVSGISNAVALAAGGDHTCAIDGVQVKCWGKNDSGQLGDGTTTQRTTPVTVSGGGNATVLAAGSLHSCAVFGNQAKCWGKNDFGQLGNGTTTNSSTPVAVSSTGAAIDLRDFVTSGEFHTCAVFGNQAKCWGLNNFGQLGDGSTTDRSTPVAVFGGTVAPPPVNPTQPVAPPPVTQTEYTVTTGVILQTAVSATAGGTLNNVTLGVTLDLSILLGFSAQGQFAAGYNIYVVALVPSGRLGLPAATWFMLPASPLTWTRFGFPMAAYLQNVAQTASVSIGILQNMDMTALTGTEFYIGYGTSDEEMLNSGRYRGIYIAR